MTPTWIASSILAADFTRLAAWVPPPRMQLTRYHGVFAADSTLRAAVAPAHRGMDGPGSRSSQAASRRTATADTKD